MTRLKVIKTLFLLFPALMTFMVLVSVFLTPITSGSQNSNSSTTTNRNSTATNRESPRDIGVPKAGNPPPAPPQDFSKNTWDLPKDFDKTKNPVEATPESVAKGKELYLARNKGNCIFCHGESGSGNEANRARLRRTPADLTKRERMSKMTDGEIFWKLSKGILGIMPVGEERMSEEERWNVVNYVRTLAKEIQE